MLRYTTSRMTTVATPRQSRIGGLTRLVLVFVLGGVVVVGVMAVMAPWGFYMGGRFHAIPLWQGWGRIHSNSAGGDYVVYVWFWPDHGKFRQLAYVQGRALVCTPRGERFNLELGGDFEKPPGTDSNGKKVTIYMFNRSVRKQLTGADRRPELELRGKWNNPDLVLDDHGSVARNFDHDANLYSDGKSHSYLYPDLSNRLYLGEVSPITLREGSKSEFESECKAIKTR